MQKLLELLKSIEIEIRAFGNLSKEILLEMTKLSEWEFRIVEGFITEVNLAKQKNITNFVYKKYDIKNPIKNNIKLDLLICACKRDQHDLILCDVHNRLMPAFHHPEIKWDYLEVWGMPVEQARNFCFNKALEMGAKKLLFIDDDMIIENTALCKIWDSMEETKALCVAAEYQKKANYVISAHGNKISTQTLLPDHLYETDLCAMGFTLINVDEVSKLIPAPYFWVFLAPDGLWAMGEDAFFTKNLIEYTNTYPIIDTRPSVLHYDKRWKKIFGTRNKDVTYATNKIDSFTIFDHVRIPPEHPIISIAMPRRSEQEPIATDLNHVVLDRGYKSEFLSIIGQPVDFARNQLAVDSVKNNSKYTLFLDNDIVLPRDAISKMLKVMEEDETEQLGMVCGDYLLKGVPIHSVHTVLDKTGKVTELNKLPEIDSASWLCGMGCSLVRTSVFRQIQFPWFVCHNVDRGDALSGGVNEDAHFTELLFQSGYQIKIIRDLKCLHVDFNNQCIYSFEKNPDFKYYTQFNFIEKFKLYSLEEYENEAKKI